MSRRKESEPHPFSHDTKALKAALAGTQEKSLAFLNTVESYKSSRENLKKTPKGMQEGIENRRRMWEVRKEMAEKYILLARLGQLDTNKYGNELLYDIIETVHAWLKEHEHDQSVQPEHIENVRRSLQRAKESWEKKTGGKLIIAENGVFEQEGD